jgi:hypothetical protein
LFPFHLCKVYSLPCSPFSLRFYFLDGRVYQCL